MNDRLRSLEASHAELTARLALPEVLADPKAVREISKALAEIDPIVTLYRRHKDVTKQLADAKQIVESTSFRLLEAIAEAISHEVLVAFDVDEVGVRVRKPAVKLGGPLDHASVEIWRRPSGKGPDGRRR